MADLGLYENFLEHSRLIEGILFSRQRAVIRKMDLAFQMPDDQFRGVFRLNKTVTIDLVKEIEPYLPRSSIDTTTKVLASLAFYASGDYQRHCGTSAFNNMHQVSVSNCMRAVTKALNNDHFRTKYIYFPQTQQERSVIKTGFYQKFGMPGVLGCVDGTHIGIVKPGENEDRFRNRKKYHSINAQIVCDSDLNILSIDASHGGADHDSFVWRHHPLKHHLEQLHQAGNETVWFLGDSGYPLRPTMLTPIVNTHPNSPERYYTDIQCLVRNSVERCIGVLKARWRCLLVDRKLHYHPSTAGFITNACVVLHNIANKARIPVDRLTRAEEEHEAEQQMHNTYTETIRGHNTLSAGQSVRQALVVRLWAARGQHQSLNRALRQARVQHLARRV